MPGHTQRPQQCTDQAGFSGAELSLQLNVQPALVLTSIGVLVRGKRLRKACAQAGRCRRIRQMQSQRG